MGFKVVNSVHVPGIDFGEELLEPFDATLVNGNWRTEEDIISNAKDADALICVGPGQPLNRRVFEGLEKCRIAASLAIGYDRIDLEGATDQCIAITNSPDYCLDEVSDQAIALMMALARKLFPIDHVVRTEHQSIVPPNRELLKRVAHPIYPMRGRTLGIIGLGRIGTTTALKAQGLGMRVIAYDPYVYGAVMKTRGVEPVDLNRLLKESDFITIHALLTDETREMIGYPELKQMKPTSYLINTARGGIVNEPALVKALEEGLIAGAGLDVNATEPVPEGDPILNFPNVILTGHSAWYSTVSDVEMWRKGMTQIVMALRGEWPTYAVNPEVKDRWMERFGKG